MLKKRTLLLGVAAIVLVVCSYMVGSVSAVQGTIQSRSLGQQPLPAETTAAYGFPRAWGGLHSRHGGRLRISRTSSWLPTERYARPT
jgi:hypothetical protein